MKAQAMKSYIVSVPVLLTAVVLSAGGTLAFQEQKVPDVATQPSAQINAPESRKEERGPVIKLPGLGKIGELPKLDFGLDLLYGASPEEREQKRRIDPNNKDDELTVKGSIKYRY
jgi:hypothetical protein